MGTIGNINQLKKKKVKESGRHLASEIEEGKLSYKMKIKIILNLVCVGG